MFFGIKRARARARGRKIKPQKFGAWWGRLSSARAPTPAAYFLIYLRGGGVDDFAILG